MTRYTGDPGASGVAMFFFLFVFFIYAAFSSADGAWAAEPSTRMPIDVEQLGALVRDAGQSDRVRANASGALAKSSDPKALKPLFDMIRGTEESPMLRAAVVRTLDQAVQKDRVAIFLGGLLDDNKQADEIRAAAAASLGALGDVKSRPALTRFSSDSAPNVRLAARTALLELGGTNAEQTELLIKILTDGAQPGGARTGAAHQLGMRNDRNALTPLLAVLAEESVVIPEPKNPGDYFASRAAARADVPMAAARALGQLGDARAAPPLLARIETAVGELRVELFKALAQLRAREGIPTARTAIVDDEDSRVRRWAAVLLKEARAIEALPELRRALEKDSDHGVRLQAVQALEILQDHEAVALISNALPKEELKELREAMEQALTSLSASAAESNDAPVKPKTN